MHFSTKYNIPNMIFQRETGNGSGGIEKFMLRKQMENFRKSSESTFFSNYGRTLPAPVYGLEFCKNQKILLSAHGDGMIYGHDVKTQKQVLQTPQISEGSGGHTDSANGCTSIDDNYFASYSDDKKVLVWDLRNMKSVVKTCLGHVNWVKNVNVMMDGKTLLSSGCDQTVRKFDLLNPEPKLDCRPLLFLDGLCRTKLHPNENILHLTTWRASIFSVHNLDVDHLEQDALNYYLTANGEIKSSSKSQIPPFTRYRNRLDVVHYVPYNGNGLTSGQSLVIHPNGSCCAVRYNRNRQEPDPYGLYYSVTSNTEWISVFDLKIPNWIRVHDDSDEYNARRVKKWRRKVKLDHLGRKSQWNIWSRMRMNEKIESDLLRNSEITKARLSLLFSQWIDDSKGGGGGGIQPQLIKNSSYYIKCDDFSPGIIKEISFSSCGRLLLDPTKDGFRLLCFDEDVGSYSCKKSETQDPQALKEIAHHKIDPINTQNCTTAEFCANGWNIVAGTLGGKVAWYETKIS